MIDPLSITLITGITATMLLIMAVILIYFFYYRQRQQAENFPAFGEPYLSNNKKDIKPTSTLQNTLGNSLQSGVKDEEKVPFHSEDEEELYSFKVFWHDLKTEIKLHIQGFPALINERDLKNTLEKMINEDGSVKEDYSQLYTVGKTETNQSVIFQPIFTKGEFVTKPYTKPCGAQILSASTADDKKLPDITIEAKSTIH